MSAHGAQYKHVTATGNALASACRLLSVVLTAGADAATVTIKDGSGGGTVVVVKAAANTTASYRFVEGARLISACHATLAGTSPVVTVEVEPLG